jgi:RND superfamily putative drug exporter
MSPLKHSKSVAARMGRWSANHWKTAVIGWLAFVVLSVFVGMQVGTRQIKQSEANVGESHVADKIISDAGFSLDKNGDSTTEQFEMVLIQSRTHSPADPAFRATIADTERTLRTFPQVTQLRSPLDADQEGLISKDGHSVLIQFTPTGSYQEAVAYIDTIVAAVDKTAAEHPAFSVEPVGLSTDKALDKEIQGGLGKAGMISIPLTILVLMLILGALVGALIPLFVGLTSVIATTGLLALSSQGIAADENIMEVVLLIGLAVGVDYSLFYMRREREERAAGRTATAALEAAAATSGRAILLSGMTVLIAMGGMFLSGDKTFMSFSVGAMLVVAVAMIASLTVLPALISRLGDKVERGRIPFVHRLNRKQGNGRVWGALLDRVLRHPVVSTVAASAVLLVLAIPTLSLHTTATGIEGITSPAVEPFSRVIDAFPGTPAPAVVAIRTDDVNTPATKAAIADLERTALATGQMHAPITVHTSRDGTIAKIEIPLAGTGNDGRATAALATLRNDVIPQTIGKLDGAQVAVTGETANSVDFNKAQTSSIPKVFGFVLLFAFLLLLISFRSIVIAIKAILLNLLSVAAAYGVMVAFFQWGWGEGILDFHSNGGIANWLPMFMFVILFGLSMDYHVFILSRIREAFDRGLSTDDAISHGIKSTAGTVSSAAMVMVGVFSVFTMLPLIDLKEMGIGLAAAVLIDATIVRGVLLPASMKLLGKANWYFPTWLRWLPQLDHGAGPAEPAPATA